MWALRDTSFTSMFHLEDNQTLPPPLPSFFINSVSTVLTLLDLDFFLSLQFGYLLDSPILVQKLQDTVFMI